MYPAFAHWFSFSEGICPFILNHFAPPIHFLCFPKSMATILPPKLVCIETLLHVPDILSLPNKRWHSAFVIIYCSRTLLSFFKDSLSQKKNITEISCCPSSTIVDLTPSNSFKIVKEKNVGSLQSLPEMKNAGVSRSPSFIIMNLKPLTQLVKEKNAELSHCPSFTIVDLKPDKRLKIDQNTLLQLLKERSLTVSKKLEGLIPSLIL